MTKRNTDPQESEVRADYLNVYRKLGGVANLHKWARNHQTLFYGYLEKLLSKPQLVQTNVAVTVADAESLRRKLLDEYERIVADRKSGIAHGAVFVNDERINDDFDAFGKTIEPIRQTRYVNGKWLTDEHVSSTRDLRPATADYPEKVPRGTNRHTNAAVEAVVSRRQPTAATPTPVVATEPSTTELFYEYGGGTWGRRPSDWGPA